MDDNQKIQELLKSLSGAVINAIKAGTAEDRQRLIQTLREMDAGMPGVNEDAAQAKAFLLALVSLLEGSPVSVEALSGPYQTIYARIVEIAVMPSGTGKGKPDGTRELLTQLSAAAVLAMRKGTPEEKKALSAKLLEVREGISADDGVRAFLSALSAMLDGNPPDPSSLPAPYSGFFGKVVAAAKEKK